MRSHQSGAEGQNPLGRPAGHASLDAAQTLCFKCILLSHLLCHSCDIANPWPNIDSSVPGLVTDLLNDPGLAAYPLHPSLFLRLYIGGNGSGLL